MSFAETKIRPGKFLKIESGQPEDIRILNDTPVEKITHGFGDTEEECGGEHCIKCKNGDTATQRFLTNVWSFTNKRVMIWQYGVGVQRKLVSIEKECEAAEKTLKDVDLKIEASGNKMGKKYEVTLKIGTREIPQGLELYTLDLPF